MIELPCKKGGYHMFDPENVAICPDCKQAIFYCTECERQIDKKPLSKCPKATVKLAALLHEALEEGELENA